MPRRNVMPSVVLHDRASLLALAEPWEALEGRAVSPFQQFIWARACAETLAEDGNLRVVVVGSPDDPAAVAPLTKPAGLFSGVELLGATLNEPTDALVGSVPGALESLTQALAGLRSAILLKRVFDGSAAVAALACLRGPRMVIQRQASAFPFLPLDVGWAEPESKLSSGRRSDLRRATRRAEREGTVSFEALEPGPEEVPQLLDDAFRVEAAGWKAKAGTALAVNEAAGSFFRNYAAVAAARGMLRLYFLRINEHTAAMQLGIVHKSRFWLLKVGYDEKFSRCSPGMLLMLHSIGHAARSGLRSYEFGGPTEGWVTVFTKQSRPCVSVAAYPTRPSSLVAMATNAGQLAMARVGSRGGH